MSEIKAPELTSKALRKNKKYEVGIVGNGMVGSAMHHLFPDAVVYDTVSSKCSFPAGLLYEEGDIQDKIKKHINNCDVVFVCVPTDGNNEGYNYKPLEETLKWLDAPLIVIKSTVEPGTTDWLMGRHKKNIIFNPEFLREATRFDDIKNENRIIIGCHSKDEFKALRSLYMTKYDHDKVEIVQTTPKIAEMVKIVNNSYFATKVSFCNEINKICELLGIDYDEMRKVWLLEPRIGKSHTIISEEGGFGGYCFPKDLRALIHTAGNYRYCAEFLREIWNSNCRFRDEFKGKEYK